MKIGEIIEVRGQKIRARVYTDKNTSNLNYNGLIIKNICVGGFVKVKKGFNDIIGKIEGEYIQEKKYNTKYIENKEIIERIIEITIIGTIDKLGNFKRGLAELPLVSNCIYILKEEEVQKVFAFAKEKSEKIAIGNIIAYEKYKLELGVQQLFGSHIGIFGNTGSGKSNTLAKIFTEIFLKYGKNEKFIKNSRFILIDFNGEYSQTISNDNKKVYNLSTRDPDDKYPLSKEYILDLEFWAIISEATEKTQQPFLKKSINMYKNIIKDESTIVTNIVKEVNWVIRGIFNYKEKYPIMKKYYEEILELTFSNIGIESNNLFKKLAYNSTTFTLYFTHYNCYLNSEEQFSGNTIVKELLDKINSGNCKFKEEINYWKLFELIIKLNYIKSLSNGYILEEHIAPLIKRLDVRINDIEKVFELSCADEDIENLKIISLLDVNTYMKKIIPMIICKKEYDSHKLIGKNKVLHIIVDEAHNILSKNSERESVTWKDYRLEVFEEIIKEGRKFGVFLTISSQRPSDISDTLISQLHNYFLHRLVNNEDIRAIGKTVSFLDNASFEMIPILPQGACIFTGIASNFPVLVQIDILDKEIQPCSQTIDLESVWT
nr:ATP-binding protein [Clostridium gasigenes]